MEERLHYPRRVQLNGTAVFVIWFSSERDGFVRGDDGRLLAACTPGALTVAAGARGIPLVNDEPVDYDFDRIRAWCAASDGARIDCSAFLNAWNFLDDLAGLHHGADTEYTRLSRKAAACYDKLFWGNILPAVTPPDERFEPVWRADELIDIRRVIETGLGLLKSELHAARIRA
jgi:hypothetical protein